ncbi:MAG: DUF4388 domain-containing protein [Desulfovibrionales bacterium]
MTHQQKIPLLSKDIYPKHQYFTHLSEGTRFFWESNFERATEEWKAADRINYSVAIPLNRIDGAIACGIDLEEVELLHFLYAVFANKVNGVGIVKSQGNVKKILFNMGRIVRVGTPNIEKRLGQFILQRKDYEQQDITRFATEAKQQNKRIGEYMVEKKLLTQQELQETLALQIEEILGEVLFWKKGYCYVQERTVNQEIGVSLRPTQFAVRTAQRFFNVSDFRNRIPSTKIVFIQSPYVEKDSREITSLSLNDQFVYSLVDGVRNIEQMVAFSGSDEVSIITSLYRLSSNGLIRRTTKVKETEDREYQEIAKVIDSLFEVYGLITGEVFQELGLRGKESIEDALQSLDPVYRRVFENLPMDEPAKMDKSAVFSNMYKYYPSPDQRFVFIDAAYAMFLGLIQEIRKFMGTGLTSGTVQSIQNKIHDIERYGAPTPLRERLIFVLQKVVEAG